MTEPTVVGTAPAEPRTVRRRPNRGAQYKMRSLTIRGVDDHIHARFDEVADERQMSKNSLMLEMLDDWYQKSVDEAMTFDEVDA